MNSEGLLQRLANAQQHSTLLSQWEMGFVESLTEQFNKHGRLSPKQVEILERIETQKLSSEAQNTRKTWIENYDDEKRRITLICAKYYLTTGYFTALATAVVEDAAYVPHEKAWKKMCQNKYALKVIANHDADPIYPVGSLVSFRSTASWRMKNDAKGMPCVVIEVGGTVISAAKGAKPYKVLPFGSAQSIVCEERHLKRCKKPKKAKKVIDTDVPF